MWNSCIYEGQVIHNRTSPKKNKFTYNIYMMYIDLNELNSLGKKIFWWGYNKWRPCSFYDKDHLWYYQKDNHLSFHERFCSFLAENQISRPERVMLLTHLRVWGYVFNPVNFYFCFDKEEKLYHIVAEVTNTFKEQRYYMIPTDSENKVHYHEDQKHFYISPFVDFDTRFKFYFQTPGDHLKVCIHSLEEEKVIVKTALVGKKRTMRNATIAKMLLKYPFVTIKVIFLIHYQALRLWRMKIRFFTKSDIDKRMESVEIDKGFPVK